MKRPTLTMQECCTLMRNNGFRVSAPTLKAGFKSGYYPFGRVKSVGPTGREAMEIYRIDVERWIREKTGGDFCDAG